jgi:hypothetical protein
MISVYAVPITDDFDDQTLSSLLSLCTREKQEQIDLSLAQRTINLNIRRI